MILICCWEVSQTRKWPCIMWLIGWKDNTWMQDSQAFDQIEISSPLPWRIPMLESTWQNWLSEVTILVPRISNVKASHPVLLLQHKKTWDIKSHEGATRTQSPCKHSDEVQSHVMSASIKWSMLQPGPLRMCIVQVWGHIMKGRDIPARVQWWAGD